ncbi:growth factor receptor bound protein 7 [Echinococcus multilocularis]|uniref:Growth factor receptor bound protein 7 n=1 Tax=Echinococcus multilocularis TaxID=6211 RepID=A0A087W2I2_ECHMU|nr:growth factor receptor bound protein 7 [Echinococcus multilocularis]
MYSTASLPSRRPRKRHLFSSKNREWSASIADMSDFPGAASTRNREPSLSSILNKSETLSTKRFPLFQRNNGCVWSGFDVNSGPECQECEGKVIMKVHNQDRAYKTVIVSDKMRVGEVCEIMLEKNHREDSIIHWQLFEERGDLLGFERPIEDHEFAMDLQRWWPAAVTPSRIWFRYNRRKYSFSDNQEHLINGSYKYANRSTLYKSLSFPGISEGIVHLKRPQAKWTRVFCFIMMSAIFYTKRTNNISKKQAKYLLDLTSMDVYVPRVETDVLTVLNTPTPHTLLLVPSSIGLLDSEAIFAIGLKSREHLLGWAEALRFYKHGQRRLMENLEDALNNRYRLQNQKVVQNSPPEECAYSQVQQTSFMYGQNRPLQQVEYTINCTPRDGNSTDTRPWGTYDQQTYAEIDDVPRTESHSFVPAMSPNNVRFPTRATTSSAPKVANADVSCRGNANANSNIYESVDEIEGIVFKSGAPFLHLELQDGLHKFPIEVHYSRGIDEKRYKLAFRSERFNNLSDLSCFYERRRHLLVGYSDFSSVQPNRLPGDSSTAF